MIAELVTPPATTPVTLDELKAQLRVQHAHEDALITSKMQAAIGYLDGVDGVLGLALITQTWRERYPRFSGCMRLALAPKAVLTAVTHYDPDGLEQAATLADFELVQDALGYVVRPKSGVVTPEIASRPDAVAIEYSVGYGAAATDVPEPIRAAVFLLAGDLYRNREETVIGAPAQRLPMGVRALIRNHRRVGL